MKLTGKEGGGKAHICLQGSGRVSEGWGNRYGLPGAALVVQVLIRELWNSAFYGKGASALDVPGQRTLRF